MTEKILKKTQIWLMKDNHLIYVSAIVLSISISLLRILQDNFINDDGILFISSANAILQSDWMAAIETFSWPFYPALIAFISLITTLSLEYSAYFINIISFVGITYYFLRNIELIHNDKTILIIAAVVLIIYPTLGDYRNMVIRDPTYWAIFLASLYYFIEYYKQPTIRNGLIWSIICMLGVLFRIENFLYLFFAPLISILLMRDSIKTRLQFAGNIILVPGIVTTVFIIILISGESLLLIDRVSGYFYELLFSVKKVLIIVYKKSKLLEQSLLDDSTKSLTFIALIGALITAYLAKHVLSLGIIYYVAFISTLKVSLKYIAREYKIPIVSYMIIAAIMGLYIYLTRFYMITRHYIPLNFLLLIFLTFGVYHFYKIWWSGNGNIYIRTPVKIILILILAISLLDALFTFGARGDYIKQAGQWIIEKHPNKKIYANSTKVLYYSGWYKTHSWEALKEWELSLTDKNRKPKNSVYAIKIKPKDKKLEKKVKKLLGKHIMAFSNKRGDKILIYVR